MGCVYQLMMRLPGGSVSQCQAKALDNAGCTAPKTAVYQSGDVQNCYCSNASACDMSAVSWQDTYVPRQSSCTAHLTRCAAILIGNVSNFQPVRYASA